MLDTKNRMKHAFEVESCHGAFVKVPFFPITCHHEHAMPLQTRRLY